jgi:hypothetical protein
MDRMDGHLRIELARLPDISSSDEVARHGLAAYGRFALLRDGGFWFADALSSHPLDTARGWYWALAPNGKLLVSARGAAAEGELLFGPDKVVLARLVDELVRRRHLGKPTSIGLESGSGPRPAFR